MILLFAGLVALAAVAVAGGIGAMPAGLLPGGEASRGGSQSMIAGGAIDGAAPARPHADGHAGPPVLNNLLEEHVEDLRTQNLLAADQGVYMMTLDGAPLVALNEDRLYNAASLTKLVTSLAALDRFPADHRFHTTFVVDGAVEDGVVGGNLGVRSDGDPTFDAKALRVAADALKRQGIKRVLGDLVVAGPFTFRSYDETPDAAARFRAALVSAGIAIDGVARTAGGVDGVELATVESEPLVDILQRMNAHSINWIADNLGTAVGGPQVLRAHLADRAGIPVTQVVVTNGSGLDDNRLTARGMANVVRALMDAAERRGVAHDRLMPLCGVDDSTVKTRFQNEEYRGAVIAKTGTQANVDGGVATLAGVAYTRGFGPVIFAVLNSNGDVHNYRKWEDRLLRSVIDESGGPAPLARSENSVPEPLEHTVRLAGRASAAPVVAAAH